MLNPGERKALKARAHQLEPVVIIGEKGLTTEVVAEINRVLAVHELIKVRAPGLGREARDEILSTVCEKTGAEPIQHVGKVFVLYRRKPKA